MLERSQQSRMNHNMHTHVKHSALIVVDVQNGFTPGGNLAVTDADQIIPLINQLAR